MAGYSIGCVQDVGRGQLRAPVLSCAFSLVHPSALRPAQLSDRSCARSLARYSERTEVMERGRGSVVGAALLVRSTCTAMMYAETCVRD